MSRPAPALTRGRRIWHRVRRVWVTAGAMTLVVFAGWSFFAFRASTAGRRALVPDERVHVLRGDGLWRFLPTRVEGRPSAGLVFFPGALVEPAAYAPLTRAAAAAGFPALLVDLPRRGAFGGADDPVVLERARTAMDELPDVPRWIIAGHSRGGVVAAQFSREGGRRLAGLLLIGTSHPRDFSLAHLTVPVTKVLGTRDCVADVDKSEANRHLLPAATRWILIEGANHSQFGWYGFQPGDCTAAIERARQQDLTIDALLQALEAAR